MATTVAEARWAVAATAVGGTVPSPAGRVGVTAAARETAATEAGTTDPVGCRAAVGAVERWVVSEAERAARAVAGAARAARAATAAAVARMAAA